MKKLFGIKTLMIILGGLVVGAAAGYVVGKRGMPLVGSRDEWAIAIYHSSSPVEAFVPDKGDEPALTIDDVTDVDADFVADPFMVKDKDTWYLFFEVLNKATDQGDLAVATSKDTKAWDYKGIVLDEPYHLSYPQVFKWNGTWYMVPETAEDKSIRLYRATGFPKKWAFVKKLVKDKAPFVDASLVRHADRWWMFTSIVGDDLLMLYHAEKLEGPWERHPKNPLIFGDANIARPSGRVIVHEGRVIRYAQDDYPVYGTLVRAFEVTELTTTTYKERPVDNNPILKPSGTGWNALGMHHIDPHQIAPNKWIACVDGYYMGRRYGLAY